MSPVNAKERVMAKLQVLTSENSRDLVSRFEQQPKELRRPISPGRFRCGSTFQAMSEELKARERDASKIGVPLIVDRGESLSHRIAEGVDGTRVRGAALIRLSGEGAIARPPPWARPSRTVFPTAYAAPGSEQRSLTEAVKKERRRRLETEDLLQTTVGHVEGGTRPPRVLRPAADPRRCTAVPGVMAGCEHLSEGPPPLGS